MGSTKPLARSHIYIFFNDTILKRNVRFIAGLENFMFQIFFSVCFNTFFTMFIRKTRAKSAKKSGRTVYIIVRASLILIALVYVTHIGKVANHFKTNHLVSRPFTCCMKSSKRLLNFPNGYVCLSSIVSCSVVFVRAYIFLFYENEFKKKRKWIKWCSFENSRRLSEP